MCTDMIRTRNRGSLLPVVLILLAFTSIMLLSAGAVVSRNASQLNNYSLISGLRETSSNVAELAAAYLSYNLFSADFSSQWSGFDDFKSFVSARGGLEGKYWGEALSMIPSDQWWLLYEDEVFAGFLETGAGLQRFSTGAVAGYDTGKYYVVSWARREGVVRYAFGLLERDFVDGEDALRFAEARRTFSEINTARQGNREEIDGGGDYVFGSATIFGGVFLESNNTNLEDIFPLGLHAAFVSPGENHNFMSLAGIDVVEFFEELRDEHLVSIGHALNGEEIDTEEQNVRSFEFPIASSISPIAENDVLAFYEGDSSGHETPFVVRFPRSAGDEHCFIEISHRDKDNKVHTVTINYDKNTMESPIDIVIHGNVRISEKLQGSDLPHKLAYINGKYSITVFGDIEISTQLMYGDFKSDFDNARPQGGNVSNQPIESWEKVGELLRAFAGSERTDYLKLTSIDGDIIANYIVGGAGQATHGIKVLSGVYAAFKGQTDNGGSFTFPELKDVVNENRLPQLFVFGSLTGHQLGGDEFEYDYRERGTTYIVTRDELDFLRNLFVASSRAGGGSGSAILNLVGLRVW